MHSLVGSEIPPFFNRLLFTCLSWDPFLFLIIYVIFYALSRLNAKQKGGIKGGIIAGVVS